MQKTMGMHKTATSLILVVSEKNNLVMLQLFPNSQFFISNLIDRLVDHNFVEMEKYHIKSIMHGAGYTHLIKNCSVSAM